VFIGHHEQTINDWLKISLDIPNEELLFSLTNNNNQALVIIHQRLNGSNR